MSSISSSALLAKSPLPEIGQPQAEFRTPLAAGLPDKRLRAVLTLVVQGVLASQSPLISQVAQGTARTEGVPRAVSERYYRFCANERFSARDLFHGLYRLAQRTVAREHPPYLVIAVDPVNFEKPYTQKLEGGSTVHKSTPPDRWGQARLTRGYPALTATIVNTRVPATTYAHWFSYTNSL